MCSFIVYLQQEYGCIYSSSFEKCFLFWDLFSGLCVSIDCGVLSETM